MKIDRQRVVKEWMVKERQRDKVERDESELTGEPSFVI